MDPKGFSGSILKWIAVATMLIDHFAAIFFTGSAYAGHLLFSWNVYVVLRAIGRLAFPLFAFLLAEGFRHTRSVEKYLSRLFLFGVLSEIPFDLAFSRTWMDWSYQNVYFTLFLGLLAVWLWQRFTRNDPGHCGTGRVLLGLLTIAGAAAAAEFGHTDYGMWGVLTVVSMVLFRESEWQRCLFSSCFLLGSSALEIFSLPSFALIHFYNGRRGRQTKYFFYLFYPLHLSLLVLLCQAFYPF